MEVSWAIHGQRDCLADLLNYFPLHEEDETCQQQESNQIHCVNVLDLVSLGEKKIKIEQDIQGRESE